MYFALQAALEGGAPGGWWWMSSFGAGFSCHGALLKVAESLRRIPSGSGVLLWPPRLMHAERFDAMKRNLRIAAPERTNPVLSMA